jgi:phosphoribosylanthranilate isomerase
MTPDFVIKVCGITTAGDAEFAVASGANALGFNFYRKSPRYIEPSQARDVIAAVRRPYLRVGVFVNGTAVDMLRIAELAGLDVLQLHGNGCEVPLNSRLRIWKATSASRPHPAADPAIEAYLLDTPTPEFGGSGRTFDWSLAAGFPHPVLLAGGLEPDNVADGIATVRPWGVDACSRLETRPGIKDDAKTRSFIQRATEAAGQLKLMGNLQEAKL